MRVITFYCFISILLISCGQNQPVKNEEGEKQANSQKREKAISELTKEYSIKYSFDSLMYDYSIQFEDLLSSNSQLISEFLVQDFLKNDSSFFLKIQAGFLPKYYLNLRVDQNSFEELINHNFSPYDYSDAVLVVKISEIRKMDLTIEVHEEIDYCSLEVEQSMNFLGKGQLIDFYLPD